jgi:glycosyltransferase involved in cell wall biosynthesis
VRLGLLVPEYPPDAIGGGGIVFQGLARGLHERGHEVVVVTARTFGAPRLPDAEPFRVLRLLELPHPSTQWKTYMPPAPQAALWHAATLLRRCDVVNAHAYGHALVDAVAALAGRDARTVFTLHGFPFTAAQSGGALGLAYRFYERVLGSRLLARAARLTAVSRAVADEAAARAGRPVAVIPNALTPLPAAAAAGNARAAGALLMVGRVERLKGIDRVIRALAHLRASGVEPPRVVVAGTDAGAQPELQRLAEELRVGAFLEFAGPVPRAELGREYASALACLVASRTESFSLVALEAMSQGAPVIAAPVGGLRDLIEDGRTGLFFEPDDPASLAAAIARIAADAKLRAMLTSNARDFARHFSWDAVLDGYEAVYRETLAAAGPAPTR